MTLFIRPTSKDIQVPIPPPGEGVLPEEGAEVEKSTYWLRRLRDGDVVKATPKKQAKPVTADASERKE